MKYLSLDLETTSLEKKPNHILQVSMIVEDSNKPIPLKDLPHFTCFVNPVEISGQPYALAMNAWILDIISGRSKEEPKYPIYEKFKWVEEAQKFLHEHFTDENGKYYKPTVAGKNVAMFDMGFIPVHLLNMFSHRTIDPAMIFIDWENDQKPPSLAECKERAGTPGDITHDAYDDALDVIKILRTDYKRKVR